MQPIALAQTGRQTSRLGYGCSSLMGALGRKQSLKLLESAYDAGIRHFDVAPMYGYGEAEGCLGLFLAHRTDVTVTTKFGLAPAKHQGLLRIGRRLTAPVLAQVPQLKRKLARAADSVAAVGTKVVFSASEASLSIDRSLKSLRRDRIDVWLLHEAEAGDLRDDRLLHFLDACVRSGKIGAFGVGSESSRIAALMAEHPEYCQVLQFDWSTLDPELPATLPFRIHHRTLTGNFRSLHSLLQKDPILCARWSQVVGHDLQSAAVLARLMLKAAFELNPKSIILFSSKNPDHMQHNACVVDDARLSGAALRLHKLLQHEPLPAMSI